MARKRRPPRRVYKDSDILRAAYLAGGGASAGEIARDIGFTTAEKVYALCSRHGLKLAPKLGNEAVLTLRLPRKVLDKIENAATLRDADPRDLVVGLLEQVAADDNLLAGLATDAVYHGPA